ncbi:pirin family protein [Kushneria pakistanensis]|uniref:Pirin family protein n=1 Tax=Kushneria pakistanensis TaxID=1508770 RepID=A0ABQ3FFQ4_9GAMM|nr:pirin family protein [Kushneria pakistanensis]GHC22186.1 pirin family protein [Kushneria pakistanensis]
MLTLRPGNERGHADHGWLESYHSFSFAGYVDPNHVHFGPLRVINEDRVAPGGGFGQHGHRDMEIFSYVLSGELAHRDTLGNGSSIGPGRVQLMTTGTGVEHSEFNHSNSEPVHFLQIWLFPRERNLAPRYSEADFPPESKRDQLRLIISPDGRNGSLRIEQDAFIHASLLDGDTALTHELSPGRRGYVHLVRGALEVNGHALEGGDALMLEDEARIELARGRDAEVLVFDLP